MFEVLQSLVSDDLFKLHVKHTTRVFHSEEKILQQGKMHHSIYFIKSGAVKVSVSANVEGKKPVHPGIIELSAGELFGEFGLFDDFPASADVIAISKCELIEIDISSFRKFLDENPQIGYKVLLEIMKTLVKRLRHADIAILNLFTWALKAHQIDKFLD